MRCRKVRKLLSLRIDGPLPARPAAGLEVHLTGCRECRIAAERLARAWRALERLETLGPAPDDWRAIVAAVGTRPQPRLPAWLYLDFVPARTVTAGILAAMVLIGGAGGVLLGRSLPSRSRDSIALESRVVVETLCELPWDSPASGLGPLLENIEGHP